MRNLKILVLIFLLCCSGKIFADIDLAGDALITKNVLNKIAKNPTIADLHVGVRTERGIVLLNGEVSSVKDAAMLVETAQSVQDVQDVLLPQLVITGSVQGLTDAVICAKIMGIYVRDKIFGDIDIPELPVLATANNGLVFLDGVVANHTQLINAIIIAKKMPGVYRVISRMNIRFSPVSAT